MRGAEMVMLTRVMPRESRIAMDAADRAREDWSFQAAPLSADELRAVAIVTIELSLIVDGALDVLKQCR